VQVMNALEVDPKRTWKGAWRWFSEDMLDCCRPLEEVKRARTPLAVLASVLTDQYSKLARRQQAAHKITMPSSDASGIGAMCTACTRVSAYG
jgi:Phytochelatin synthase